MTNSGKRFMAFCKRGSSNGIAQSKDWAKYKWVTNPHALASME